MGTCQDLGAFTDTESANGPVDQGWKHAVGVDPSPWCWEHSVRECLWLQQIEHVHGLTVRALPLPEEWDKPHVLPLPKEMPSTSSLGMSAKKV